MEVLVWLITIILRNREIDFLRYCRQGENFRLQRGRQGQGVKSHRKAYIGLKRGKGKQKEGTFTEIGKLYFETNQGNPGDFFVQLFDEITLADSSIFSQWKANLPS